MWIGLQVKYQLFLSDFNETWIFSTYFRKILNIRLQESPFSGGQVVPYRRTDWRGEANSRFSQLFERAYKPQYKWKNSENTVPMTALPFSPLHITLRPMSTGRLSTAKNITNYCVDRMSRWHKGNEGLGEIVHPLLSTASWTHMSGRIPPLILQHGTTSTWPALRTWEGTPGTHRTWRCIGPAATLDAF